MCSFFLFVVAFAILFPTLFFSVRVVRSLFEYSFNFFFQQKFFIFRRSALFFFVVGSFYQCIAMLMVLLLDFIVVPFWCPFCWSVLCITAWRHIPFHLYMYTFLLFFSFDFGVSAVVCNLYSLCNRVAAHFIAFAKWTESEVIKDIGWNTQWDRKERKKHETALKQVVVIRLEWGWMFLLLFLVHFFCCFLSGAARTDTLNVKKEKKGTKS